MDLILLVLFLCILGAVIWLLTTKIPMDPMWRLAIQILAFVLILLYLLRRFGGIPNVL
jgi:hypothetical protein